jgi:hypothetical protein
MFCQVAPISDVSQFDLLLSRFFLRSWRDAETEALSAKGTVVPRYSRLGYSRISVIVGFFARTNVH